MGEQDQARAGLGELPPAAEVGEYRHRPAAREAGHEHRLQAVPDGEHHGLPGGLVDVFEERPGEFPQAEPSGEEAATSHSRRLTR